jgi:hypothetical protein
VGEFPYPEGATEWDAAGFVAAVEAEDEAAAIARIRGALVQDLPYASLRAAIGEAALAHYAAFGHCAIYTLKAGQLIEGLGEQVAEPVLLALTRMLVRARREERLPEFRGYTKALTCGATIRVRGRIASPENVPEPSSIASPNLLSLPHRTPPEPELFFLFLISISCWCGPCGVVGDATASSKHSGKSTGLWGKPGLSSQTRYPSCRSTSTARGCRRSPRRGERVALASRWGHHDGAAASSGDPCVSL